MSVRCTTYLIAEVRYVKRPGSRITCVETVDEFPVENYDAALEAATVAAAEFPPECNAEPHVKEVTL